jgi:hypothetical protein
MLRSAGAGAGVTLAGAASARERTADERVEQESLDLSIDVTLPETIALGEEVEFGITVEVPEELIPNWWEFSSQLYIDDELVSETQFAVNDVLFSFQFSHTFGETGERSLRVECELDDTFLNITHEGSVTIPLDLTDWTSRTVTGAAFEGPEILTDEIENYRQQLAAELGLNVFLLAKENERTLVFTEEDPVEGRVTVEGTSLAVPFEFNGMRFDVIGDATITPDDGQTEVTLDELYTNPDEYAFQRVSVDAEHVTTSVRTTSNVAPVDFATRTGVLVENWPTVNEVFADFEEDVQRIIEDPSAENFERVLPLGDPLVFTLSFDSGFWGGGAQTTTGIVVPPECPIREFIEEVDPEAEVLDVKPAPLLYLESEQPHGTTVADVDELTDRADRLDGDLVTFEGQFLEQALSVKQTAEELTPCGDDAVPLGSACGEIPLDVLVHGGVAWADIPVFEDDIVPVVGLSSHSLSEFTSTRLRTCQITGQVIHTSRISDELPDATMLLAYEVSEIDDSGDVPPDSEALITGLLDEIIEALRREIDAGSADLPPELPPVVENGSPPADHDGDGLYEAVRGENEVTILDVQALFNNLESDVVQNHATAFNFSGSDESEVTILDVQGLFNELDSRQQ